jgi:uncharacterized hydrophobic protein (TIGR00271 family)
MKKLLSYFNLQREVETPSLVIETIDKGASFKGTNLWVLVFAIFIASLGLNVNSAAVIIGAMLVSPLMGPIMGIGMAVAINDVALLRKSITNHVFATTIGLLTSTLFFLISPLNQAHSEILARTSPNLYDVLIALFGGFAGIIATSSKLKGNVIPGVAIATALMPPLCTAGFGLATLNFQFLFGALYLFFINTVFIAIATLVTVRFLKFPVKHPEDKKSRLRSKIVIIAVVVLAVGPSIYFAYDMIKQNKFVNNASRFIEGEAVIEGDYLLNKKINASKRTIILTFGGRDISDDQINGLKSKLSFYDLKGTNLIIQQGFSTVNEDNENSELQAITQALFEKDTEIALLKHQLDSVEGKNLPVLQILKELQSLFPEVKSLMLMPGTEVNDSINRRLMVALVKSEKTISSSTQKKIMEWMKIRLKEEDCKVVFE